MKLVMNSIANLSSSVYFWGSMVSDSRSTPCSNAPLGSEFALAVLHTEHLPNAPVAPYEKDGQQNIVTFSRCCLFSSNL